MQRVGSQLGAIGLILRERRKIDQPEGFIGSSREVGGHEVAEDIASAFANRNLLVSRVFCDVGQLVGIDCVTQKKCDHDECLQAQFNVGGSKIVRWQPKYQINL